MRVLVCGGRHYDDYTNVKETLDRVFKEGNHLTLIHGGATGADALADRWAKESGYDCIAFPANWKAHGNRAGPLRNQEMIDVGKPDLVVTFSGGRGTADMVRRAKKAGIEVMEVKE